MVTDVSGQPILPTVSGTAFQEECLTLKDGTDRLSRNVGNHQYTLRKIPEERRSHLYRRGSLKLRVDFHSLYEYSAPALLFSLSVRPAAILPRTVRAASAWTLSAAVLVGLSYPVEWWAFIHCKLTTLCYPVDRH